ncbi:MAG: hypothetical protein AAF496_03565 [Pseudomonadota bacterium]
MKTISILAVAASLLIGLATGALAKEIKRQNQFVDAVADKTLVGNGASIVISSDGKISGQLENGSKIVGAWAWDKRYWCRNIIVGGNELPQDCQTVSLDGNQVTFTRNKGKGDSGGTYAITN